MLPVSWRWLKSPPWLARQRLGLWLMALLVCWALGLGLIRTQVLRPMDGALTDYWHVLAGVIGPAPDVALVLIDDASLNDYPNDPLVFWTPQLAHAIRVLREVGARVVGLDVLLSLSPDQWLNAHVRTHPDESLDQALQAEIASGQVVMVSAQALDANGHSRVLLPAQPWVLAVPDLDLAGHIGLADLLQDEDGVVRRFDLRPAMKDGPPQSGMPGMGFAALLAERAKPGLLQTWTPGPHHIGYMGPPGHLMRLSLRDLLQPQAAQNPRVQALKGRVVIIGGEYAGHNDSHPTPYLSGMWRDRGDYMAGAEIQANIVQTLLSSRAPRSASLFELAVAMAGVLGVLWLTWLRIGLTAGAVLTLVVMGVCVGAGWLAFDAGILIPSASMAMSVLVSYLTVLGLRYALEERERQRITRLFGRYVSSDVVNQLLTNASALRLGGQRQQITVLFSDIRQFTTLSEAMQAEEVVEFLNQYFARICQIILEEGGTIDKFIGDAVMVLFGTPLPQSDQADRALRTGLRMLHAASEFDVWMQQRFSGRGLPHFEIGVGIHTGHAVVGNIGSETRTEYTAIGDTVNMASRIEGQTKDLGARLLCSLACVQACQQPVHTGRHWDVTVKGKSEPVRLFEILVP